MTEHEVLKQRSFDMRLTAEIAVLKLEVEVTSWQPCGCCRIGKIPRRPGTPAANLRWYRKRWHLAYCRVPGFREHMPTKNISATLGEAISEFWEFLHAAFLDVRATAKASKHPLLIESEEEHQAALERLRQRAGWARLSTTDVRRISLYKTRKW